MRYPKPPIERFWKHVDKSKGYGPRGTCWLWTGCKNRCGYGFFFAASAVIAHRWIYEQLHGPQYRKGKRLDVCHKCDVRHCVRPSHLFSATHFENVRDCIRKGRFRNDHKTGNQWWKDRTIVKNQYGTWPA